MNDQRARFVALVNLAFSDPDGFLQEVREFPEVLSLRGPLEETLLQYLVVEDKGDLVTQLAGLGAVLDVENSCGQTPLMDCATIGNLEMAKLLVGLEATVEYQSNRDGRTALHWSAEFGRKEIYDFLVEHGADVDLEDWNGERPKDILNREF